MLIRLFLEINESKLEVLKLIAGRVSKLKRIQKEEKLSID